MSETGHVPESFPDGIIFMSMFNDITDPSEKVQESVLLKREKWLLTWQISDLFFLWSRIGTDLVIQRVEACF